MGKPRRPRGDRPASQPKPPLPAKPTLQAEPPAPSGAAIEAPVTERVAALAEAPQGAASPHAGPAEPAMQAVADAFEAPSEPLPEPLPEPDFEPRSDPAPAEIPDDGPPPATGPEGQAGPAVAMPAIPSVLVASPGAVGVPAQPVILAPGRWDVVEIGSTIARYMRGEGEAAMAHFRALSDARTPADLIRLQVGEVQRAADASLSCWVTVIGKASRVVAFR